ncbi:MAG: thioredoxin family protein [Ignavibacteriaceae bacterium]
MKVLIIIFFSILFFKSILFAQNNNLCIIAKDTIVIDTSNHQRILLGYCNRQAFKDTSFSWWFNSIYDMYEVDSITALKLKDKIDNIKITIIMGTWCSDSRRVVPKFLKVTDYLKIPDNDVSILTIGRDKKGRANETDSLKIELVPTIIFYRNGKEIGRIVESPKETIEKDVLKILDS